MSSEPVTMEDIKETKNTVKMVGLIGGLLLFAWMLSSPPPQGLSGDGWIVLSVAILMGLWWVTEAVPIAVTALIPLVAFPLLDVGNIKEAAKGFSNKAIFLTLGGFIIGVALEKWNLHLRIAMNTVRLVGTRPSRIIAGFMISAAFLSMWITNTATTVLMLPIAVSVVKLLVDKSDGSEVSKRNFGTSMMIGLAYAASIGGMMTLVGTSTNVMFKGFFEETYGLDISFVDWMKIAVPVGLILLIFTWIMLVRIVFPCRLEANDGVKTIIAEQLQKLGHMKSGETRTLFVFIFTASLWMFKDPLNAHFTWLHLNDAVTAILGAILLFVIPADLKKGKFLLTWKEAERIPWGVLLLLGGGLSMASFLNSTGVAAWMGDYLSENYSDINLIALVVLTTVIIIALSSLMSNVATLTAFLPVIVAMSLGFGENPLLLAVPAALAASCAFMLPVGTPPNAIVFGSGYIRIPQMVNAGFILTIIAVIVINVLSYFLLPLVFGVETGIIPQWAQK